MLNTVLEAPVVTEPKLAPPRMLHHTAYVTHDVEATVKFYTEILGMKLVSAVVDDSIPSTGDPWPYLHLFFQMQDGSTVAFFESIGLPKPSPDSHPAYGIFNHLAMDVGTREEVDRWAKRLAAHGVEMVGPTDHGIIYSIYFKDPNGIRLELTATTDPNWVNHGDQAAADVEAWAQAKAMAAAGGDPDAVLNWVKEHRGKHKHD
ncbi:MAG: hypothetical protein JWO33_600 [Caulobacteraceae bacterium]|nr:hypothetical protein [Caulobacteraceae bacterium]